MRDGIRARWVLAVAALLLLAVGIPVARQFGSPGEPGPVSAPAASHDPPATFDAGPGTPLPQAADADPLPAVLSGFDAYLTAPDGVQVVDTRSGQLRAAVSPVDSPATGPAAPVPLDGTPAHPPLLITVGGRQVVIAVFGVRIPGHGTTVGHDGVQVIEVDAASYATVASARIDLPVSLSGQSALREAWAVGVSGANVLVGVQLGPDRTPAGYAVDLAAGRTVWQLPGFDPATLVGDVAVGTVLDAQGGYRVTGVGLADGRRVWLTAGADALIATVWPAGPTLVAVTSTDAVTGLRSLTMLQGATGAVRTTQDSTGGVICRYDERSITVCYQEVSDDAWVAGFSVSTGRQLWQLPDAAAGRIAPRVSTAWHGVVYGSTDSGTVALDARTGADRPAAPDVAPDLVDAYVGVTAATVDSPRATAHVARS